MFVTCGFFLSEFSVEGDSWVLAFWMFQVLFAAMVGLKVSSEEEMEGLDFTEHGGNACPDFEVLSHSGIGSIGGSGGSGLASAASGLSYLKPSKEAPQIKNRHRHLTKKRHVQVTSGHGAFLSFSIPPDFFKFDFAIYYGSFRYIVSAIKVTRSYLYGNGIIQCRGDL